MKESELKSCEICGEQQHLFYNEYTEEWMCESCLNIDLDSRGD